jgi:antitoxin ParD1/3/4
MARYISIDLDDRSERFIEQELTSGHYGSICEVVREGLRLMEDRELRLEALREALNEGERGTPTPLDIETFLKERHAAWRAQGRDRRK